MIIRETLKDGERAFAVNVRLKADKSFTRYAAFDNYREANACAKALAVPNELNLWEAVDIDLITMENGKAHYKTVKSVMCERR